MKNCHKWMILCVVVALAFVFVLPKFGVSLAGASLLFPILMIGCCVLPMIMMMFSSRSEKGGCCGQKDKSKTSSSDEKELNPTSEKTSCH